jgi:predicted nucleic acid-binding protein
VRTHVLDASALFRYLMNADGAEVVDQLFRQAAVSRLPILMSVVNWGEVYYGLVKRAGLTRTDGTMTNLLGRVPLSLVAVTADDAVRAARLKAQHNLPYADAFAAALTGHQRVLVTADVEHFERVPKLRLLKLPRAMKT